ncbi:unnamed protein product [Clavelina lepadiformis]|uniref:Uncharacterized protein n=1 Tax=Clavelina lepadiformis TaxID=159417 RepID=A0ABP0FF10_CLALP
MKSSENNSNENPDNNAELQRDTENISLSAETQETGSIKTTRAVLSDQHPRQVLFLTAHTTDCLKATFFSPAHLSRLKPIRETNRKQDTYESALDHIKTLEAV